MGYRYKEHVYKPKPEAKTKNKNAPYKHSVATGHTIDYEGIELINRADSNFKLCIKEKLHIVEDKPDKLFVNLVLFCEYISNLKVNCLGF